MLRNILAAISVTVVLAFAIAICLFTAPPAHAESTPPPQPTYRGPFTHENLTIYFIEAPDTLKGDYLTLEEAMRDKKVVVNETGNVNELTIQNVGDKNVYIQSGEIVKGGKQDRTLGNDLVLAPHSPKVPIAAFCVEHGRWTQRGHESAALFASSTDAVAGNKMKLAANTAYGGGQQQKVWDEVAQNQKKLAQNVKPVETAVAIPTPGIEGGTGGSFQLTLENKDVQAEVDKYVKSLQTAPDRTDDVNVIGYVVAINGKMSCADVYGSNQLFKKLWPKLLKSAAVEAAAEYQKDLKWAEPSPEQLRAELAAPEKGKKTDKQINDRLNVCAYECPESVLLETRESAAPAATTQPAGYLHRSYLRKD